MQTKTWKFGDWINQSRVACNLVTNFVVLLIKKPWQCFVLSCTLHIATPSLPSPTLVGGGVQLHVSYLGITTIFKLVCQAFVLITFAFSCYLRSVEARNCCSGQRETRTQIGQIGKTKKCIGYQIWKPVNIFHKNWKPVNIFHKNWKLNVKKQKIGKLQWTPKPRNWSFLYKSRKTNLKNSQNHKTKNPNALLLEVWSFTL